MSESVKTAAPPPAAPGAWPLLGHYLMLRRDPLGFMNSLRGHGELVRIAAGPLRFLVVCDAALAHDVITDLRTFDRTGTVYDRIRRAMGAGVATSAYAEHRRQRLMMQPAFHVRHLPGYAEVMRTQTTALLDGWRGGEVVDMVQEMFRLTTSIALRALFSTRLDPARSEKLREAFEVYLRGSYTQIAFPALKYLPLPSSLRYQAALRLWRRQVRELIAGYRGEGDDEQDLMARLLAARGDEGEGLTEQELFDQVAVLLIAGGETTSAALTWAMYLLCTHPEVLGAVCAEADRVLGGEIAQWEHLPELDLTARAIQEALRLYPPSWLIQRTTTRETRLGGRLIPAGTSILVSQYLLHHDPALFPDPERFDPYRWPSRGGAVPAETRRAYMPFGGGPTKCLGEQFATAEATLALASILTRWTLDLRDPQGASKPDSRLVLLPRRLPVRLTARSR
ncbi:MAG TPA: cytochrome P450 [Actinocrinis sp.]